MGCDIHLVLERRRHDGRWIGVDAFNGHHCQYPKPGDAMDGWHSPVARSRNYERFAQLAGVRGDGPAPRGLPDDMSETAALLVEDWAGDGHSHSWLPMKDAAAVFLATERNPPEMAKKYPDSHFFGVDTSGASGKSRDDYRLIFWFDN